VPALLQRLDDFKLVFGKHAPKPVCPLDRSRGIDRNVVGIDFLGEHLGGNQEVLAEPELARDLAAYGDVVAGHHLDRQA